MAIDQTTLQAWLLANPATTADAAGVTAAMNAHQVPNPVTAQILLGKLSQTSQAAITEFP